MAAGLIAFGPAAARLLTTFGGDFNPDEVIRRAHAVLTLLDAQLAGRKWLVARTTPTLADVALYSYVARAPEGNVAIDGYEAVIRWLREIESLPGFVPFAATAVGLSKGA